MHLETLPGDACAVAQQLPRRSRYWPGLQRRRSSLAGCRPARRCRRQAARAPRPPGQPPPAQAETPPTKQRLVRRPSQHTGKVPLLAGPPALTTSWVPESPAMARVWAAFCCCCLQTWPCILILCARLLSVANCAVMRIRKPPPRTHTLVTGT